MDMLNLFWPVDHLPHMTRGEQRLAVRLESRLQGRGICYGKSQPSPPAPDPNIGIAARENAALSKEMAGVARDELIWNKARWEEVKPIYNEVIQTELAQMKQSGDRGTEQWNLYKKLFQPVEERMVQDAMAYDSPERKERMAAAAAADVSSSHDAANAVVQRNMQSMGVNPNDPKYAAIMSQAGLARARDTAGAMNTARTNTELTGMSMRQGAAQFGRNMPGTSIAQDAAALNSGNAAAGNTTGQNAARATAVGSAAPWYSGAVGANTAAGNLYAQQYGLQMQGYNAAQQRQGSLWGGIGQLAGTVIGGWASGGFAMKDGGLVRRRVEAAETGVPVSTEPEAIEGEYETVDENLSIDPTDGEVMDALMSNGLRRDINYAGMPRRGASDMTADGVVDGPGHGTSDSVPARLSKDEAVLNAEAVKLLGEEFINRVNREGLRRRRAVAPDGVYKYEGVPA